MGVSDGFQLLIDRVDKLSLIVGLVALILSVLKGYIVPGFIYQRERDRGDKAEEKLVQALSISEKHQEALEGLKDRTEEIQDLVRKLPNRLYLDRNQGLEGRG